MSKKAFYLSLTALLGMLLFLILHQVTIFLYEYFQIIGNFNDGLSYGQFLILDYFTLFLVIIGGMWYGIWLGMYWFEKVYVQRSHGGLAHHLAQNYWPIKQAKSVGSKMAEVKKRLETDMWELEKLAKPIMADSKLEPKVRRVVRKSAPKKLKSVK